MGAKEKSIRLLRNQTCDTCKSRGLRKGWFCDFCHNEPKNGTCKYWNERPNAYRVLAKAIDTEMQNEIDFEITQMVSTGKWK